MRARAALAAVAVIGLLAGACGHPQPSTEAPPPRHPAGIALLSDRTGTQDPAAAGRLAAADSRFAGSLYGRLASGTDNVVFSPVSIASVLQMLAMGARGRTAAQVRHVLHLADGSPDRLAGQVAALRAGLSVLARAGQLRTADAIWTQTGMPLQQQFRHDLQRAFGTVAARTDFANDPSGARTQINAAIAAATKGRIGTLLPAGVVDPLTRVVLTDAIYLNAKWADPFDPKDTHERTFTRPDGSQVRVPTMHRSGMISYARHAGYQVASLPYAGGRMAMQLLLPDGPLAPLERKVQTDGLPSLTAGQRPQRVELSVPRWDLTAAPALTPALTSLGMPDAFDPHRADLSGISGKQRLYLQAVVHKAMIKVGEKGTEAAAASAGAVGTTAAPVVDARMDLDRPFLFAITDTATHTPLFLGRVTDPSAH